MSAATARGLHRLHDHAPWIVDDPFALVLVGPEWPELAASGERLWHEPGRARSGVLVRSRYAEDRLLAGDHEQYVILGAGLDAFAWRRPDLLRRLRVFEVDHPTTQAWKLARVAALGLPTGNRHVFVPLDLAHDDLLRRLELATFDRTKRTMLCWVGTTMYLERDAIAATLAIVARLAPGSGIVLSYNPLPELLDDDGRAFLAAVTRLVDGMGEPLRSFFAPDEIEVLARSCGLLVRDHPTSDDLIARYCAGRRDAVRPFTTERLIELGVPE